jgi:hypothetical protein
MLNPLAPFRWPLSHVRQFAAALFYVVVIRLGLWIVPYKRLDSWISQRIPEGCLERTDMQMVRLNAEFVRLASRFVPAATCLTQALALRTTLQRQLQSSELKVGVEKDQNGRLLAHAWLEIDGRIVIGRVPNIRRFSVMRYSRQLV